MRRVLEKMAWAMANARGGAWLVLQAGFNMKSILPPKLGEQHSLSVPINQSELPQILGIMIAHTRKHAAGKSKQNCAKCDCALQGMR